MASTLGPLLLSLQLAALTTLILVVLGTPLAWWLSRTQSAFKPVIQAIVALPIVLPPTVMGFYLLIVLGPYGAIGRWWVEVTGDARQVRPTRMQRLDVVLRQGRRVLGVGAQEGFVLCGHFSSSPF